MYRRMAFLGASIGGLMSGILSSMRGGLPNFFAMNALDAATPFRSERPHRRIKRRQGTVRRGWTPNFYGVAGPNSREAARRRAQGAHQRQIDSHKPGTVQPRHIFGDANG